MPSTEQLEQAAARRAVVHRRIASSISARGYPPTVSELALATSVSKRTTRGDLAALAAEGKIEVDPGVPRGIRLR